MFTNSIIGEDALANLSIEKEGEDGPITGFVRIRSRSQGLALALGNLKGLKASAA
jgi:coatomer subunit beta